MSEPTSFTVVLSADDLALISLGQQALLARVNEMGTRINAQLAEQQKPATETPSDAG